MDRKNTIIQLLSEHWDEFIYMLQNYRLDTGHALPEELQDLTFLLAEYMEATGATFIRDGVELGTADEKGLLEKAKHIKQKRDADSVTEVGSIINRDGLFVIQKHKGCVDIDPAFQHLVNSVL